MNLQQWLPDIAWPALRNSLIMAAIGIVVLGASFLLHTTFTEEEVLVSNTTVWSEQPVTTTFTASASQDISVRMEFSRFPLSSQILPVLNEERFDPITNVTEYVVPIKESELQSVNQLTLREVSNVGGKITVNRLWVERIPQYINVVHVLLNILSIALIIGPLTIYSYRAFRHQEELEVMFPAFLRDVVEGMHAGMPLPQSIIAAEDNEYGALSPYVRNIAAKIEWGVPFDTILSDFAENTQSVHIQRAVNSIIHAHQTGGAIPAVLEAISTNLREFNALRQERKHQMYGEIMTGYVIYVVFVVILASIIGYLLPALVSTGQLFSLQGTGTNITIILDQYSVLFRNLALLQAVFSGMVIGKLSEGTFSAGGKHMLILGIIGYVGLVLFI